MCTSSVHHKKGFDWATLLWMDSSKCVSVNSTVKERRVSYGELSMVSPTHCSQPPPEGALILKSESTRSEQGTQVQFPDHFLSVSASEETCPQSWPSHTSSNIRIQSHKNNENFDSDERRALGGAFWTCGSNGRTLTKRNTLPLEEPRASDGGMKASHQKQH
ncbi:hypothetical protein WMY93_000905 [Mugilogobius chulae]|uniref:Uncharacterized protein n=1 Tax=Mugilogobius chulae TaxID=88201 RepID=A0AAW0QB86_9GOBI